MGIPADSTPGGESRFHNWIGVHKFTTDPVYPLWWKTTEVYRVQLPFNEIKALKELKIDQRFDITIVIPRLKSFSAKDLKNILQKPENVYNNSLASNYVWSVRNYFEEELNVLKNTKSISELDKALNDMNIVESPGMLWIYALENPNFFHDSQHKYRIGHNRIIFVEHLNDVEVFGQLCEQIAKNIVIKAENLKNTFGNLWNSKAKLLKPDKDQMRSVHATPGYDVTFTLIQAESRVSWDIIDGINDYLKPFLDKLSLFAEFNIKSQVFYFKKLNVQPDFDSDRKHYILNPDQLPHVINPVEELLGSHVSVNPNLNFLIYIPPKSESPLLIYEEGKPSSTNAFLSPQWGGFLIYNVNGTETDLDMAYIMSVFVTQLRQLIGLPNVPPEGLPVDSSALSSWELDYLLRKRTLQNLAISINSLNSLAQLLHEIRNIVINDDVGERVYESVKAVQSSVEFLQRGDLKSAFIQSKISFIASEKAFFDPSMLELLYFPDDQKYAIYIPLFLPVSIPILTSSLAILKSWKKEKQKME
ncbi:GPI transamidase component PIG-S [Nymphon striatum]|nr:GPI transamidase component PIG-S [Nymphon striatum]